MSLEKKFKELEQEPRKREEVDKRLGKKGYYSQKQEDAELGKKGYYKPAEPVKQVEKAVRDNPLVALALLALVGGLAYFVFFYQPVVSTGFDLVVYSGEARLPLASISVYDGDALLATAVTDSNGKASFAGLPNKPLRFGVSSSVGSAERVINPTGRRIFNLNLEGGVQSDVVSLIVIDRETRQGIAGAKVAYSLGAGRERLFVETGIDGRAVIPVAGEFIIRLRVVDPRGRYAPQSLTLLAQESFSIELIPVNGEAQLELPSPFEQLASVSVLIRSEAGQQVENGEVRAFYSFTGAEISTSEIQNGAAQITNIAVDSLVTFVATVPDFYPESFEVLVTSEPQPVLLNLRQIDEEAQLTRISAFTAGEPLQGTVHVFQRGNYSQLLSVSLEAGVAELALPEGDYYALVASPGFLPGRTREFFSGEEVNIELLPTSEGVELEVSVTDEDNSAVVGAVVSVVSSGFLLDLPRTSQFGAPVVFTISPGEVEVRAALEPSESTRVVELVDRTAVTLVILAHAALAELTVKSALDGSLVDSTLTSFYNGRVYQTCSGNGGCVLPVRGGSDVAIEITSPGFLSQIFYAEPVPEFSSFSQEVKLVPVSLAEAVKAELVDVTDSSGNVVSGNVLRPGKYAARFLVSGQSAEELSLYVRVKDDKQNASLAGVHLLEPLSVEGVEVAKSGVFLPSKPQCVDLAEPIFAPPYKWTELTFFNSPSQQVDVDFVVPQGIRDDSRFSFEFHARAVSGEVHSRFPADPILGFAPASPLKANCYAETASAEFVVSQVGPAQQVFPLIEGEFTNGDALSFDPSQRAIRSQNNLDAYELQVDSILPGDAMPLTLQSDSQCVLLAKQPNSTSQNPTSSCYRYDAGKAMLVFESRELNPLCPIRLEGDKFKLPSGSRVNSDSASLTVLATCTGVEKTIPINVKLVSDLESLAVKPEPQHLGEGDSAKLLFVINNRQVQRRNVAVEFQTTRLNHQLAGASVQPVALRGPGTLEVTENDELIAEVILENKQTSFKPGVGVLSHRQTTCVAGDIHCCANGWCTRGALTDFIPSFRETAQRVAQSTAFRRGNNAPLNHFADAFTFTTVVQAAQGSQEAFQVDGINFSSPLTCAPGNPGVYELVASTSNGVEWSYSANILRLEAGDYVQRPSACSASSNATPASLTTDSGETLLCNFLWPRDNCIVSSKNASITAIDQLSKLRFELVNCMYPVFPSAPVCPGTKMILPSVNIGNVKTEVEFDPSDSPNAFEKIWTAVSDANASRFSLFSWRNQLKCVVPPSVQQFAITTASTAIPDYAEQEAKAKAPGIQSDVCSRQDFFNLGVVPNYDTLIPLAGVCCPTNINAEFCTKRRGKFFVSVRGDEIKVVTQWGLTDSCYPYWPFPTTIRGLLQRENFVSAAFGLTEFLASNGADFELSLSSEVPGALPVSSTGLSSKECRSNSDCASFDQCSVNTIYSYSGSGPGGKGTCVGASPTAPGVCAYSSTVVKETCSGGTQCSEQNGQSVSCGSCGNAGEQCCLQSDGLNAFCRAGAGCEVTQSSTRCVAQCGRLGKPVCGGWQSSVEPCREGRIKRPSETGLAYTICS